MWRHTRSTLRAAAIASVVTVGSLAAVESGPAGAAPIANELAPEISESALRAVAALETYSASGSVGDMLVMVWHRATTASFVARELGYDEMDMITAWSTAPLDHQRAVLTALTQVGVPYRTNANDPGVGFDCSGLTTFAWAGAGTELYHQSGTQIAESERVTRETAQAGDLVHYPGHIMMYLGVEDAIVHAVQTGRTVEVDTISSRRRDSVSWGNPDTAS